MKSIVFTQSNGMLGLCHPVVSRDDGAEFTHEDAVKRALEKDIPAGATKVAIIDRDTLPSDRTFRDAWTHNGKTFGHDMTKARDIHRSRLRVARSPLLAALDVEYQRADEAGDAAAKSRIAKQKQALRDVTKHPAIDAAKTVEELKAITYKLPVSERWEEPK